MASPAESVAPFLHQVGGHFGLLSWRGGTILKPFSVRENHFYKTMPKDIRQFAPSYSGVVSLSFDEELLRSLVVQRADVEPRNTCNENATDESKQAIAGALVAQNPWALRCHRRHVEYLRKTACNLHCFMVLENVVGGLKAPCALDVKLGTRQHGDSASPTKARLQTDKCAKSTSASLGCRLIGMQLFERRARLFRCVDKYSGRALDRGLLARHVRAFVDDAPPIARRFRALLVRLALVLQSAVGCRFFSSSLLLVYDGDAADVDARVDSCDVRMIDFEHSTYDGYLSDDAYDGPDDGYVLGLRNLIAILDELA